MPLWWKNSAIQAAVRITLILIAIYLLYQRKLIIVNTATVSIFINASKHPMHSRSAYNSLSRLSCKRSMVKILQMMQNRDYGSPTRGEENVTACETVEILKQMND